MRLCAYWDCMKEVDEGMSFCREHGMKLNRQLIDKCPKCGRYKDIRQKMCPDCNYGRPVADWKVASRNLDEVTEYTEPSPVDEPVNDRAEQTYTLGHSIKDTSVYSRGEAMCPSCGSPHLTYKEVFDYFRCNDCETTFITPVYSYGETRERMRGIETSQRIGPGFSNESRTMEPPPAREEPLQRQKEPPLRHEESRIWQESPQEIAQPRLESQPVRWEEPRIQVPRTSSPFSREPDLEVMRKRQVEDRALNMKALKMKGQGGKMGWIYLLVVLCIVVLAALLCWVFFSDQIGNALDGLFSGIIRALT